MSEAELHHEIRAGVAFWGYEKDGDLIGVMGIQHVNDVSLIRHAYVVPAMQKSGFGSLLLFQLKQLTTRPLLVGTWADVRWAIRFYEKHGFRIVSKEEKDRLLRAYWTISERQVETSVVLGDCTWFEYLRSPGG
jgi:N-acetylglutamate synthase-like GNAT family acetyltransferase